MAVSRMLKMQLLGHSAVKNDLKRYLRAHGVVEITTRVADSAPPEPRRDLETGLESADNALDYLSAYEPPKSFFEKVSTGPLETSDEASIELAGRVSVTGIADRCTGLQGAARSARDDLARSRERVSALEPGGELIAVLEACPGRRLRPVRVLRSLATSG